LSRLVDPVAKIADAVPILGLEIDEVSLCDVGRLDAAVDCVAVHEECHRVLLEIGGSALGLNRHIGWPPHLGSQGFPNWYWREVPLIVARVGPLAS
jgi:hypothetical protein